MRRGWMRWVVVGCVGSQLLWSAETLVIVRESDSPARIQEVRRQLEGLLSVDRSLVRLLGEEPKISVKEAGGHYLLELGPLKDEERSKLFTARLRRIFPEAKLLEIERVRERVPVPAPAVHSPAAGDAEESLKLWIALFALALTGVLALFVSSRKIQALRKEQERLRETHREMESQFNDLFHQMGSNIQRMGREIVETTNELIEKVDREEVGVPLQQLINTETKILDTTNTLLEFLRIKAGKVPVTPEPFDLNRLLDEVLGNLSTEIRSTEDVELVYLLDNELPKELIGPFARMAETLTYLLENAIVQSGEGEVSLAAKVARISKGKHALSFLIEYRTPPSRQEPREGYFQPLFDEERGEYRRLECFVARELVRLMEGAIDVSFEEERVQLKILLPVRIDEKERRRYRLRSLELTDKRVLVVNRNLRSSRAIAQLFGYFRHRVDVMPIEEYEARRPPLAHYDVLVLEEALIDPLLIGFIEKVRKHRPLKVVSVRNIFAPAEPHFNPGFVDQRLTKPLTLERVYRLIEELYPSSMEESGKEKKSPPPKEKEERPFESSIPATPDIGLQEFGEFAGSTLLIVEDNPVNLKMMMKVLEDSGIRLLSAVNGEEAIRRVQEHPEIDLVLMDINMPVMDGYAATKRIRQIPGREELPIVALSALSVENEIERMRESGLDGYLPKPLNIGQLYTVFDRHLRRSAARGEAPRIEKREVLYPRAVDMERALAHAGGNELLLRDVLREFVELYGTSDRILTALYERGDGERMRAEMVDLLGLSGTIGAMELYEAVKELYKASLLHEEEKIPECLERYSLALRRLKGSVRKYLESLGEPLPEE